MNYGQAAKQILEHIGGSKNVMSAAHCATRLRIAVIDHEKCALKAIEDVEGVKGVFFTAGQVQVILGTGNVSKVYAEFIDIANISKSSIEKTEQDGAAKPKIIKKALKVIGNIMDSGKEEKIEDKPEKSGNSPEKAEDQPGKESIIYAPVGGRVIAMKNVKEQVFASEALGKGAAVIPDEGRIVAPVDGKIAMLFPTKHAIAISTEDGMAILIHIGLNTVTLEGKYYTAHVNTGDIIKKGQLLMTFDMAAMVQEGYDLTVPVIVTNSDEYEHLEMTRREQVASGDVLIRIS